MLAHRTGSPAAHVKIPRKVGIGQKCDTAPVLLRVLVSGGASLGLVVSGGALLVVLFIVMSSARVKHNGWDPASPCIFLLSHRTSKIDVHSPIDPISKATP